MGGTLANVSPSLFDLLGAEGAQALRRLSRRQQFRRREVLFRQGDLGEVVYLIETGHVLVRGEGALDQPVTMAVLGPGDYFGDIAVLSQDSRRSATVIALDTCVTHAVPGERFLELRDRHPAIRRIMTDTLARTSRRLDERIVDVRHSDARGRLLRQLGLLDELFDGPIPFTQEDLADHIGLSRVTVNQLLSALAGEGLVELGRGSVRVVRAVPL